MIDSADSCRRPRAESAQLIASVCLLCWFGMQAVHEAGHMLGALITHAEIQQVVLHPLTISRTDVINSSAPLFVVWAGPMVGITLPLLLWATPRNHFPSLAGVFRFFAGFCLIANGCYIGVGFVDPVGDAEQMLQLGTPPFVLLLFGSLSAPLGLWMWNGTLPVFFERGEFSPTPNQVRWMVIVAVTLMAILFLLDFR